MKRFISAVVAILLVALLPTNLFAATDPNDFVFSKFEADYYLSRTEEKISQLRVREVMVALFPEFDQNHGIIRAIPKVYQNHDLAIQNIRVTDEAGQVLNYEESSENNNLVLKIGNTDEFVRGDKTYVIEYTISNVTANFEGYDEFFWNVNGTQWQQKFGYVEARLHLSADLVGALQDKRRCFTGAAGSTSESCTITLAPNDASVIGFKSDYVLDKKETLSIAVGFNAGTFVPYSVPLSQVLFMAAMIFLGGVLPPLVALVIVIRNWRQVGRDPKGKGVIVPEYLPPKEVSVLGSDTILKEKFVPSALSAQIIDLAVRHYLKVYEIKEKKIFKDKLDYEVELVKDPSDLREEEQKVITLLFGDFTVGKRISMSALTAKLYEQAKEIGKSVGEKLALEGWFRSAPEKARRPYYVWGSALISVPFLAVFLSIFAMLYTLGFALAGVILLIGATVMPARTEKGVALRDYLYGLREYMKLAEAERLKVLQSPHGELTEKIDVGDNRQLIKLYEKLLPYAMLFGIEKQWVKEFAGLYAQSPDWYAGSTGFNSAVFATSLGNFSAVSTTTFTPPSNSSSSGFSGGSAGGGGGGGGGGGW